MGEGLQPGSGEVSEEEFVKKEHQLEASGEDVDVPPHTKRLEEMRQEEKNQPDLPSTWQTREQDH